MANVKAELSEITDFLASASGPEEIVAYRVPEGAQRYMSRLLEKNNRGTITESELAELERFMDIEYEFRMAKARARELLAERG